MSLRSFSFWVRIFFFHAFSQGIPTFLTFWHIYEMIRFVHLYVAASNQPKNAFPEGSNFSVFWMESFVIN